MIITKPTIKRVTTRVSDITKSPDTSVDTLVKEIKMYILQSVAAKGIPTHIALEVAARLIVLIAIIDAPTVGK